MPKRGGVLDFMGLKEDFVGEWSHPRDENLPGQNCELPGLSGRNAWLFCSEMIDSRSKRQPRARRRHKGSAEYHRVHDCGGIRVWEFGRNGRPLMYLRVHAVTDKPARGSERTGWVEETKRSSSR